MAKVNRNDKCPCGSGKKYKNCCGASTKVNEPLINGQLNLLHHRLVTHGLSKYNKSVDTFISQYENQPFQDDAQIMSVYNTGLTIWMFNKPILSQKRSLFDIYTANQFQAIIVPARTLYNKWKEQEPSVYEIVTVSDHKEFIVVKDLRDEQTYKVFYLATDNYIEGSLIIGSLIPYANYYGFLYSTIKLFEHDYLEVKQLLIQFDESKTDNFPELLAEILQQGMEINQNKQSSHDEVAQLFADSLTEKNIEDAIILKGIKAWKKYCAQVNPIIKNTRTYACALEYYVQKVLLDNDGITQDQLAKEYDVSKNTVSTNYRKIYNELK